METIQSQQTQPPEIGETTISTPTSGNTDDHFKVVHVPRAMRSNDGLHFVPALAVDPGEIKRRKAQYKTGERTQRLQAYGLCVASCMVACSLENDTTDHFADTLRYHLLNSSWNERFGYGRGLDRDTGVMNSPVEMPEMLIDKTQTPQRSELALGLSYELSALSSLALTQAGVMNTLGVRSENLAKQLHRRLAVAAMGMCAIGNYTELANHHNKEGRAGWLREEFLEIIASSALVGLTVGEHPSMAALSEPHSKTSAHFNREKPSAQTQYVIKKAYEISADGFGL